MQFALFKSVHILRNIAHSNLCPLSRYTPTAIRISSNDSLETYRLLSNRDFFQKQRDFKRPLSPFISIFKPQLTWTMSIAFRSTEIFIAGAMSSLFIYLFLMNYNSFPDLLRTIKDLHLPPSLVVSAKFLFGVPFSYFIIGGIRHTAWDLGYGFELPTLYKTAYATIILSFLGGLVIAIYGLF